MATVTRQSERLITGREYAAMPENKRTELVRGRITLMTPPPAWEHGKTECNLVCPLGMFVDTHDLGRIAVGEVGLYTGRDPDTVRGADILFISHAQLAKRNLDEPYLDVAPELIVEIRSPSNTRAEIEEKLGEYFAIGVKLVWLADPATRTVSVYRSLTDVRHLTASDELSGEDVLPGFRIAVAKIFK
jgi:Uma2 family endonuclease